MDYSIPLTRTKILVPRHRADILSRQRLLTQLDELMDNRLIIIAAPAGYGKTSLLIDYVNKCQMPVCWLTVDDLDRDPQRFIAHFIAAVQMQYPDFGKTSLPALQSMSQDKINLDALVSLIVNDAYDTISEHFAVVIDDYHLIEDSRDINYLLDRFLLMVDENAHIIISSRRLLPLPDMPLLVARSMVGGLGFEDLAFRNEEIQNLYLQNFKLTISERDANALANLTEGWITGLILSTQVVNGRVTTRFQAYPVTGVGLYDYLAQQVLDLQTDQLKQFLYRASLLEEFDANLCAEVIGQALGIQEDWMRLMEELQRNNLFVLPVVEEQIWLRFHHLFRDFLQNRMLREFPDEARKIQLRLAEYYQNLGEWERAYQVYERMGNNEFIARMIESAGPILVAHGRLLTLQHWLEQLPENLLDKSPALVSIQGVAKVMLGDTRDGLELLDHALALLKTDEDLALKTHTLVRRSSAFRMVGEYRLALEDANRAIQLTDNHADLSMIRASAFHSKGSVLHYLGNLVDSLTWLGRAKDEFRKINDEDSSVKVSMEIAMVSRYLGNFKTAEEIYRESLAYYQSTGNIVWQANLLNNLGVLHTLAGEYEVALIELERSIQYAKMGGYVRLEAYALTSLGDLFKDLRAFKEAGEAYQKARDAVRQMSDQFLKFYLMLVESEMEILRGHVRRAEEPLLLAQKMVAEAGSDYEKNLISLAESRLAYLKKEYDHALDLLLPAQAYFEKEGHHVESIRCLFLLESTYLQLGRFSEASDLLGRINPVIESQELQNVMAASGEPLLSIFSENALPEKITEKIQPLQRLLEQYSKRLPGLRKQLRRQSRIVPLSPPELSIKTFGKIQISLGDHVISGTEWKAQSARDMLLLLLLHPEGMTKEQVGAQFWPESTPAELKLRFKNLIYRLRHAAGKDVVLFDDETYYFNHALDYEADFEVFRRELALAEAQSDIHEKIEHLTSAVRLYRGDFLPEIEDEWAATERAWFSQQYRDALSRLIKLLMENGQFEPALGFVQIALQADPTDETVHRQAMRIHASLGNLAAVVKQYEQCCAELITEFGDQAEPSAQTQSLFEILTRQKRR
jgi:LuxR family maltose regulon positive regulatory protein